MEINEIVSRIIGEVEPIGVSEIDEGRLENLSELTSLTEDLIEQIRVVSKYKNRPESSMQIAGERAEKFIKKLIYRICKEM